MEAGGVSREAIRTGQVTRLREDQIPVQFYDYLRLNYEIQGDTEAEKARFLKFTRLSFPSSSVAIWDLRALYLPHELTDDSLDVTPPVVEVLTPVDGSVVLADGAGLEVPMHDGDLRQRQIDLSPSTVELDGQNILPSSDLDSEIDPAGSVFERPHLPIGDLHGVARPQPGLLPASWADPLLVGACTIGLARVGGDLGGLIGYRLNPFDPSAAEAMAGLGSGVGGFGGFVASVKAAADLVLKPAAEGFDKREPEEPAHGGELTGSASR